MGKGSCKEQGGERGGQTCDIETRMLERESAGDRGLGERNGVGSAAESVRKCDSESRCFVC